MRNFIWFVLGIAFSAIYSLTPASEALPIVRVKLQVWSEQGGNSLSQARTEELLKHVKEKMKEARIRLNIKKVRYGNAANDDWTHGLTTLDGVYTAMERGWYQARREGGMFNPKAFKHKKKKRTYKLVLHPGFLYKGELWMAGLANGICPVSEYTRVASSTAHEANEKNQPRFIHSVLVAAHELGHLFGAKHENWTGDGGKTYMPNIMQSASAGRYGDTHGLSLPWLQSSVVRMSRCLRSA